MRPSADSLAFPTDDALSTPGSSRTSQRTIEKPPECDASFEQDTFLCIEYLLGDFALVGLPSQQKCDLGSIGHRLPAPSSPYWTGSELVACLNSSVFIVRFNPFDYEFTEVSCVAVGRFNGTFVVFDSYEEPAYRSFRSLDLLRANQGVDSELNEVQLLESFDNISFEDEFIVSTSIGSTAVELFDGESLRRVELPLPHPWIENASYVSDV